MTLPHVAVITVVLRCSSDTESCCLSVWHLVDKASAIMQTCRRLHPCLLLQIC